MKIDVVQIKQMILNQMVKELNSNQPSDLINDSMLRSKLIEFQDSNNSIRALSLTSIIAMELFKDSGEFNFNKASKINLKLKPQLKQLLELKPYGNISETQTLAVDSLMTVLHDKVLSQLKSQVDLIPEHELNHNPKYIELQKSIDSLSETLKPQLQKFLATSIEFQDSSHGSLTLSIYSQSLLQGGTFAIADHDLKLKVILPARSQTTLSAMQIKNIILNNEHSKIPHPTLIHGGIGSKLIGQVAYCHAPSIIDDKYKSKISLILDCSLEQLNHNVIDNAVSILEIKSDNQTRLWRELLLNEIANLNKKLLNNPNKKQNKRWELLSDLLIKVNCYQLPAVADVKLDGVATINDLAKYLLKQRCSKLEKISAAQWSWLIEMALCQNEAGKSNNLSYLTKDLNFKSEFVELFVKAQAILSLTKNLNITKANKSVLLEEIPLAINNTSAIIELMSLKQPLDKDKTLYLSEISQTLLNATNTLQNKFESISLKAPASLNDSKINIRGAQLLLQNDDQIAANNYQTIHQVYSKLLICLEHSKQEQLLPNQWLTQLNLTKAQQNIANLSPLALEPCISYIESLQQQNVYDKEQVNIAIRELDSGIKLLKSTVIANSIHRFNLNLESKNIDNSFQINKKLTKLLVPNLTINLNEKLLFEDRLYNKTIQAKNSNTIRNEQENKGGNKYQAFENVIIDLVNHESLKKLPLFYDLSSGNLQLTNWVLSLRATEKGKRFPESLMRLLLDEGVQPLIKKLEQLAKQYNDLNEPSKKPALLDKYNNMLASVISDIEVIEKTSNRLEKMQQNILSSKKNNKLFYKKQTSSKYELISQTIPKLIVLNIDIITLDKDGNINSPLFLEWLTTAQTSGSKIALVCDNQLALEKHQQIKEKFNQHNLKTNLTFDLSKSTPAEFLATLDTQLSFKYPNLTKKQCLLIDKDRRDLVMVNYLRNNIELDDLNQVNTESQDKLLHKLALRYNYLSEDTAYFNGESKTPPKAAPFAYNSQGFLNSLLVRSVSIENFTKNIFKWLQNLFSGPIIKIEREKDNKSLMDFFNNHQEQFIDGTKNETGDLITTTVDNKPNFLKLFNVAGIDANTYQSMIADVGFKDILNEVFNSQHKMITSLSKFDLMNLLNNVFKQYLAEKDKPFFNYKSWFGQEFEMQLVMHHSIEEDKQSKLSKKIALKVEQAINEFVFSALENHQTIAAKNPQFAQENLIAASNNTLQQVKLLIKILSNDTKLHNFTTLELKELYNKLNLDLNKLELYLNIDTPLEKEAIEIAYNQLHTYKHILFNGNATLLTGRRFNDNFIELYQAFKSQTFPLDYQANSSDQISKATLEILSNKHQRLCLDINQQVEQLLQRFFSLDFLNSPNNLDLIKLTTDLQSLSQQVNLYNENINDNQLDNVASVLNVILDLINQSNNDHKNLIVTFFSHWQEQWTDDFKKQIKLKFHNIIYQQIINLEQQFILAKNDITKSKPSLKELAEVESLIKQFNNKFGLHFDSIRLERLKTLLPLRAKNMPIYIENNYLLLESKDEILFLRKYMSQMSQTELDLHIDSQLVSSCSSPNLNTYINISKQQFEENFISSYLKLLLADAIDCLDLKEQILDSPSSLMTFIAEQSAAKFATPCSFSQLNNIESLISSAAKFNSKYLSIYGRSLIQTEGLILLQKQVSQAASHLFLKQLQQKIIHQTVNSNWNFSWFELSIWANQQEIKLNIDGHDELFYLPKAVKDQYLQLTKFLDSDNENKNYSTFKKHMLDLSKAIKPQLSEHRADNYVSFFKSYDADNMEHEAAAQVQQNN